MNKNKMSYVLGPAPSLGYGWLWVGRIFFAVFIYNIVMIFNFIFIANIHHWKAAPKMGLG